MYFEKPTGVGVYIREVYNRLAKKFDADKTSYTCYVYDNKDLADGHLKTIRLPFLFEKIMRPFISVHRLLWNIFYLPFIAKKYDLVYSPSTHGSPFIKNQVITIHDLICLEFPKQHRFQFLYFKYILPFIIRASKKVIVISAFTKEEVIKHYKVAPEKIIVIYNGGNHFKENKENAQVLPENLLNLLSGGKGFFLSVGASYPHKNAEIVINVAAQLSEYKFVITGPCNKYFKSLKKKALQQGINNIIFLEYVDTPVLNLLYKNCIANIYISLYEGFGFPPIEAASNNKISVLAGNGALKEIFDGYGVFVSPKNEDEIANTLLNIVSAQFDMNEYQNKFPGLFEKYTWQKTSQYVFEVLQAALNTQ